MRDISGGATRVTPRSVGRVWREVRDAAVRAAGRGWPVVPGVCRPDEWGFSQMAPLQDTGDLAPVTDPERAEVLWTQRRHVEVLLVCGRGIDTLEVPFRRAGARREPERGRRLMRAGGGVR